MRDGNLKTLGLGQAWKRFKEFFRKSPRPETAKKSRIPRITEKGLARVEQHLNDILINQGLPEEFQSGERGMLERLRAGNRTLQDIEFYLHELKESAVFRRTGDLLGAHLEALQWRGVTEKSLFHPEVIQQNPQLFNESWREL